MGVVESRAGGPVGDAEELGDLRRGIAHEVVQNKDRPLLWRQAPEAAFQLIPEPHAKELVGRGRPFERKNAQVGHPTTFARRVLETHVHEESLEPGIKPVRIAERSQVTPGDHQRVLEGILGPVDVPENPVAEGEEVVRASPDQVDERLPIPSLCRLDELLIHRLALVLAPDRGAVQLYWWQHAAGRSFFRPLSHKEPGRGHRVA